MTGDLTQAIEKALGGRVATSRPLSGGCIGEVYQADLDDGRRVVVKVDEGADPRLDNEGYMLRYLAEHSQLPVPEVLHSVPTLLIMTFVDGRSHFSSAAERHAAEILASLHGIRAQAYGLECDTLIGGLHQPNPWNDSWIDFFREHRLLFMARKAHNEGPLSGRQLQRIESFAARLGDFIEEPACPALLHGDVWTTNVLANQGRITGFVDPAIYYGHPEIELAFITLFSTFGEDFFKRYGELRPIAPGFFEQRRDIYNLYPLLVHTRLFGSSYMSGVERTLSHLGF